MKTNQQEKRFLKKVKGLLSESAGNLDSQTRQRLKHIRLDALRSAEKKRARLFFSSRWATAGAFAAVMMAAIAIFFLLRTSPRDVSSQYIEDYEIIASKEHFDLYENLDFYCWLAAEENEG
jgi:hypothetical protein